MLEKRLTKWEHDSDLIDEGSHQNQSIFVFTRLLKAMNDGLSDDFEGQNCFFNAGHNLCFVYAWRLLLRQDLHSLTVVQLPNRQQKRQKLFNHVMENSSISSQPFCGQRLDGVMQNQKGSMLHQRVLNLDSLNQSRQQLGPLSRHIKSSDLPYDNRGLQRNVEHWL